MLAVTGTAAASAAPAPPLKPCPPTNTSTGHANCLATEACCTEMYFGASGCMVQQPSGDTTCCAPGPALPVSTTLPNCLIIGDSVSDQYTPSVAALLNTTCLVQHAPWVGGGSANDVANGLRNLQQCRWLRTALRPDQPVAWDLVMFNFGLHDLMHVWPDSLALYTEELANVTDILLASGARRVAYALTTPFQADELPGCGPYCNVVPPTAAGAAGAGALGGAWPQPTNGGNGRCGQPQCAVGALGCGVPNATAKAASPDPSAPGCGPPTHAVTVLNGAAAGVMAARSVPVLDLNSLVHSHCGGMDYGSCALCDNETQYMGIFCGYHYAPVGVSILAHAVADFFTGLLAAPPTLPALAAPPPPPQPQQPPAAAAPSDVAVVQLFAAYQGFPNCARQPLLVRTQGALLAFYEGRPGIFPTDLCSGTFYPATPDFPIYLRRSQDGGATWSPAANLTHGNLDFLVAVQDAARGAVHLLAQVGDAGVLQLTSRDEGRSWGAPRTLNLAQPGFASLIPGVGHGIQVQGALCGAGNPTCSGAAGRLVLPFVATRIGPVSNDTACGTCASALVYSDDGGRSWVLGAVSEQNGSREAALVQLERCVLR